MSSSSSPFRLRPGVPPGPPSAARDAFGTPAARADGGADAAEKALLRAMLDATAEGISVVDRDLRLVAWNRRFVELLDLPGDEVRPGRPFVELLRFQAARGDFGPCDPQAEAARRASAFLEREMTALERPTRGGGAVEVRRYAMPDGGFMALYADITERKRAKTALHESEERFALAVEGANDGICDWNLRTGYAFRSDRVRAMLGVTAQEERPTAEWWLSRIHPADLDGYRAAVRAAFRSGERLFVREYRVRHQDGGWRWLLDRAVMQRDGAGRVVRMVGSVADISDRKDMELRLRAANASLKESKRQLEIALDNMSQGLTVFDADQRLVLANRRYAELYSLPPEAVRPGTHLRDLMELSVALGNYDPASADAAVRTRLEAARSRTRRTLRQRLSDGRVIEVIHMPLAEGGAVCTFTDVTANERRERDLRQAKEEAESASRAKSSFLANMSHELRTPLNAILGFAEMMQMQLVGEMPAPYVEYAGDIRHSGEHLLTLINAILDLSKIEAGKAQVRDELVEAAEIVQAGVALVRPQALKGGVAVEAEIAPPGLVLRADPTALRQIVVNLLSNAVKFTPPGGTVRIAASVRADGRPVVAVSDTGIGIPAELHQRIFEPVFQVEGDLGRRYEGTGLGLSLVKGMAGLMGASVEVDSAVNRGSTFTVTFPAERRAAPADA